MMDIGHLKCISAVKSMKAVHPLTPAAFPGIHCPMHTALSLATRIKDVSTLVIGTAECGYYSRNIPLAAPYADQSLHWSYILDSKAVVFGFRKGVHEALKEMDAAGAKVILLLATCVPELIGEDLESLCGEIQPEMHAKLIHIPLGNFKCGGYQPGYWKTLLAMGKLIEKTSVKTRTVNVLGRSERETHIPMPSVLSFLKANGISLRFIAPDASLVDFTGAGDAQLSLSFSPFMNPIGEYLEKEHGVPFISLHDVYDVKAIEAAYVAIEKHLTLKMDRHMADLKKAARMLHQKTAALLKDRHYIMAHIGALQPLPLSIYFSELGASPIMINMEDFYPSDAVWRGKLIEAAADPILCLMLNEHMDQPIIEALCPDMVIGDWGGRSGEKITTVQVLDFYGQVGYERTVALLNRVIETLLQEKKGEVYGVI